MDIIWIWIFLFCILQGQTCTDVDEKSFGELEYNQEKHEKERRETILEIRDTEINYGRDLKILKEVCISCLFPFLVKLLKIPNFYDMFNSLWKYIFLKNFKRHNYYWYFGQL